MRSITLTSKDIDRFWRKVDRRGPDECWSWMAGKDGKGYGSFFVGTANYIAPRVSWAIHHGEIPNGLGVLHTCDNPPCVNPNHLFLGTQKDNNEDRENKGRGSFGSKHGMSILKESDIKEIRELMKNGVSQEEIAKKFKVDRTTISAVKRGLSWSWLKR